MNPATAAPAAVPGPAPGQGRAWRWFPRQLGRRLIFGSLFLLLMVQALVYAVIDEGIDRNARTQLDAQCTAGERVLNNLLAQNTRVLSDGVALLSRDFGFFEAVKSADRPTLASALDNHAARIGADFAALLAPDFKPIAIGETADKAAARLVSSLRLEDVTELPTSRYVVLQGRPVQLVMTALKPPQLNEVVVMGFAIDQRVVGAVEELSGVRAVLVTRTADNATAIRSASPSARPSPVLASLTQGRAMLTLDDAAGRGERVMAHAITLPTLGESRLHAVLFRSLDEAVAPYRTLQMTLLVITLVAIAVFAAGSLAVTRQITRPVGELVQASQRLGSGDFATPVPAEALKREDELGVLGRAVDRARQDLAHADAELNRLAFEDTLTGLPNRIRFEARLREVLAAGTPLSLLALNMDRLEHVNQLLGREQGDRVLQEAAARLSALAALAQSPAAASGPSVPISTPTLARLGGDEFALLLPGADAQAAQAMAEAIHRAFEPPMSLAGGTVDLSAAVGLCTWAGRAAGEAPEGSVLLSRALLALSRAKRARERTVAHEASMDAGSARALSLTGELRQALKQGELRLFLQPKLTLADGSVNTAETLLRWQHPERGMVPPGQFIPFAEETGFIRALTAWVIEEAASVWAGHAAHGLKLRLSVNLSAHDLMRPDLLDQLQASTQRHGMPTAAMCLEITESAIALDPQRALQTLHALKALGHPLSIDDFGAGYTSLAQLTALPVDELKIDMLFVREMDRDPAKARMVASLVRLAHDLKLHVVAEGVENAQILAQLQAMGCDVVQGWHIAKPMPSGDWTAWAQARAAANDAAATA